MPILYPFNGFADVPGRQRTVAKILGISQSGVSRQSNIDVSPLKGVKKRKERSDAFEIQHPTLLPKITNHWVTFIVTFGIKQNQHSFHALCLCIWQCSLSKQSPSFKDVITKHCTERGAHKRQRVDGSLKIVCVHGELKCKVRIHYPLHLCHVLQSTNVAPRMHGTPATLQGFPAV